jgi:hypothetical protein
VPPQDARAREPDGRTPALLLAALLGAILAVFVLVRLPLLTGDAAARGWNGDGAIFGLMAKKIHDGRGFDVFFWGQNYTGPLTPALAAGIRRAFLDPAGVGATGGPIALRLASMAEIAFGICLYVLGLEKLFGPAIAAATGLWMAIGPPFFVRLSAVHRSELGPEMAFALGSVLFLLAAGALTRPRPFLDRAAGRFVFGLVAGVGWWMNQTIVFVLLPAAAVVVWRHRTRLVALLAGAVLGYAPVWLGRLLGWYPLAAGPVVPPWLPSGFFARLVRFLGVDAWRFLGLDGIAPPVVLGTAAVAVLALLLAGAWGTLPPAPRKGRSPVGLGLVAAIAALGALTYLLRNVDASQERFLAPALPAALALVLVALAEGANRLRRIVPSGFVAAAAGGLALLVAAFFWRHARETVAEILREPDPRAPLEAILREGYAVCHAGYDTAYTLQFLSDERVRFVPYHSPDRNRAESARLRTLEGPQCLVTNDGSVRRWLPSDAALEGGPRRHRAETRPGG